MISLPLLAISFIMNVVAVLFVITSLFLILIVLIQKGKGGGLSAAFGGGMAGGLMGTKTGDFLTWITVGCVALFLFLGVLMAKYYRSPETEFGQPEVTTPATSGSTAGQSRPTGSPTTSTSIDEQPTIEDELPVDSESPPGPVETDDAADREIAPVDDANS
jgi:preprotein translocase subunit SecG